jgi:chemotaxis family two-component system response regulator Rcp1
MKHIRVLLVEDNEGDILLTREAFELSTINYALDVVRNGEEAMHYLHGEFAYKGGSLPDLIILDINLPKLSGHEVLNAIKGSEKLKSIPVIMFTTSSTERDIVASYKNYANCYITKPFDTNEFHESVQCIEDFWANLAHLPTGS